MVHRDYLEHLYANLASANNDLRIAESDAQVPTQPHLADHTTEMVDIARHAVEVAEISINKYYACHNRPSPLNYAV